MKKIVLSCLLSCAVFSSYATNFLILTDLHFNPFSECAPNVLPCPSLVRLINSPVQDWPKDFTEEPMSGAKQEVNNAFLTIGLGSLNETVSKQKLKGVFVTGDLLSHDFDETYSTYAPTSMNNQAGLTEFSLKTIEYVLGQIHTHFPAQPLYFTLGNNDSDRGDYVLPSSVWLQALGSDLSTYVPNPANMEETFSQGGFYSLSLSKNITLISLNINLLSQANPDQSEAIYQLQWLDSTLKKAETENRHVILIQHMPFGVDLYKTAKDSGTPVLLLEPNLQAQYLAVLQRYSDCITGIYAGHYHMDYFSLINNTTPLVGTLGFSPIFGNNPGFKVLALDDQGHLSGYTTYAAMLTPENISWHPLYLFSQVYGNPADFVSTLQHFPKQLDAPQVVSYRTYFNGDQPAYPQPISDDKNWLYYYCGMLDMDAASYQQCLR